MNIGKGLVLLAVIIFLSLGFVSEKPDYPRIGIVTSLKQDSIAYAAGFRSIGESVRKMISPSLSDSELRTNLKDIKSAKCRVLMCNLFFPGSIKIAGPAVNERQVLGYVDSVLTMARKAGIKYIVLGSSGSRNIPENYDLDKAKDDFVVLCKKMGQVAANHKVTILLENLQKSETNFLTTLNAAADIVRRVDEPYFRLNADIFHMLREGESPEEIIAAGDLIGFCEIAEKDKRSLPGVAGDDFRPYLRALKHIGYHGFIFIEGNTNDPVRDIPISFKYLTNQISEVYAES
ncbi:sugar phosphate isomerase/epimerase family protein [Pedobacter sp.]|uniref:sugar phosphate isomerase/epimerase family protein n=1 Tax=Pedobacter sp. TaxID=1411316 RepID=UPI003D7F6F36